MEYKQSRHDLGVSHLTTKAELDVETLCTHTRVGTREICIHQIHRVNLHSLRMTRDYRDQ